MDRKGFDPIQFAKDFKEELAKEEGVAGDASDARMEPILPSPEQVPQIDKANIGEVPPPDKSGPEIKSKPALPETEPEDIKQAELKKAAGDFWAKQSQIAEVRAKKTGRFASLAKSLGIKTRNLDDDPEVMSLEKEGHDLYRDLLSKGISLYKGDRPQLENFLRHFDEFKVFRATYNLEMEKRAEVAGFPENVLAGLNKIGKRWSELKTWQKIAIGAGGGLFVTAGGIALGAGTFGAATLTAGYRWVFRGFGAMAMGIGRKVISDEKMMNEMGNESEAWLKKRMDILNKYESNLDKGIENILSNTGTYYVRKDFEQRRLENNRKAVKLAAKTFIISSIIGESLRLGSQATGINLGSILKKIGGYAGFSGGTQSLYPEGKYGSAGYGTETEGHEVVDAHPEGKYGSIGHGTEAESHVNEFDEKYGPEKYGTEAEGHIPEGKTSIVTEEAEKSPAAGAEIASSDSEEPKNIKIGFNEVKQGGGIERSAQAIIKANPKEFGLDPDDPKLNTKVGRKAHILAKELAKKLGFEGDDGYKEFNKIASNRVQVGDEIRIFKDAATGKLNMTYNGAAFDDVLSPDNVPETEAAEPKIFQAAPTEEIALNKAKLFTEDVKPKAGASEYQPQKTGAKISGMEEIESRQKLAQQNYARAVQAEQDWQVRRERMSGLNETVSYEAGLRQGIATRGLLKNIIHDAGIGNNVSLWDESAEKWYDEFTNSEKLVSQDVLQNDSVADINKKREILKTIFSQLPKPQAGETTWQAFLRGLSQDPNNLVKINRVLGRK